MMKKKTAGANEARERAAAVRTRRLMKELKEIKRLQESRPDPVFTVSIDHLDLIRPLSHSNFFYTS